MPSPASRPALEVLPLGRVPYAEALELQEQLRDARLRGEVGDVVLLLEHPHVVTLGRGTRPGSLRCPEAELRRRGYEVHRVRRGGDVTYHGPGQLVAYPILDLETRGRDVHRYLRALEDVLIDTVADFGVAARRRPGFTGVWVDETRKLASIGIGVRRWVTVHGFALNVGCDLTRFASIVPCGLRDAEMIDLTTVLGRPVSIDRARACVAAHLKRVLA